MNDKIRQILNNTYLASLATNTDNGIWVSDVVFVADDVSPAIYWISDPETKHSRAIDKNTSAEVALSITLSKEPSDKKVGLQMQGFAHQVDGDTYDLVCKHWQKRGLVPPDRDEDVLQGDVWYVFYPTLIEIFDQGKKERLELLNRKHILDLKKQLASDSRDYTFLWCDRPNYQYPKHQHTKPVSFYVLQGFVTFTLEDGSEIRVSEGERWNEVVGTKHSAKASDKGCVYLTGQVDEGDVSVKIS